MTSMKVRWAPEITPQVGPSTSERTLNGPLPYELAFQYSVPAAHPSAAAHLGRPLLRGHLRPDGRVGQPPLPLGAG